MHGKLTTPLPMQTLQPGRTDVAGLHFETLREYLDVRSPSVGGWLVEAAERFDTLEAAINRIRFMGKFDMLMTGTSA